MTIIRASATTTALEALGQENNPIIAWENLITTASSITTTSGTEQTDGEAENLGYLSTYDQWSVAIDGTGFARVWFVFPANIDVTCCAIAVHNIGTIGADVKFQYSLNSGSTWVTAGTAASPTDDQAILWHFEEITADYWRIVIENGTPSDIANIGVAFIGEPTIVERRIYQGYTPPITQTRVELQPNMTEGGHFVGSSTIRKGSGATANITYLDPATLRGADWKGFQRHFNGGSPFFWAWRPDKYGDVFYAKRGGNAVVPTNSGPRDLMALTLEMDFYDDV